jgi:branched-chain amino acid transport system substrate-binding protein
MMRNKKIKFSLALLFTFVLCVMTACQSSSTTSGKSEKGGPIKIGAAFPLTGGSAYQGKSFKQAIDLATKEINDKGGVLNRKIEVQFEDDKGVPAEGVNVVQKLITQDRVSAILGDFNSSVTLAVRGITQQNKVVQITPGSTADDITSPGHPYMFRNLMPNNAQGPAIAKYATEKLGIKKVAILAENTDYGHSGVDNYKKTAEKLGAKVIDIEYYNLGDKDFTAQLTKIKNLHPEGVFIPGLITEGAQILKQAVNLGIKTQWLGLGGFTNDQFYNLSEGAAEGMIHVSYFEPGAYNYFPDSKSFVENYKKAYGVNPDMYAASGYEAMYILADAIKKAGSDDREAIKKAMAKLKNLPGVTGPTTFDQNGQAKKKMLFVKVHNGTRVPIGESK